ncbi:thioredoxin family protein [Flavobacterium sp. CS20]|jgi:thioredoxin-related protein|uniref:thioredoxin family protein n=1 Tax=Flavobacterium sp. CS20 TaxID=2775246 RepID=UPI001B3A465C|nr:thioredoxin family protein [Flavobacterium sp. CS20]QTY28241.1 thioredoxin family protein [Flavobacterium sp. CS20]
MKLVFQLSVLFISLTLSAQDWQSNLDKSKQLAQDENKQILLVFSGSDWCAPCIKLEKKIWTSEVFQNYAKDNLVLLKADFPRFKKNQLPKDQQEHNKWLAEHYNPKGYFPLVVLMDANGKVLNQLGYENVDPQAYIKAINAY